MSESLKLPDPLFKLIIRFNNGEKFYFITDELIAAHHIAADTRYALVSSFALQNPNECTAVTLINLNDVAFIKTEKITLDELAAEKRTAGLHSFASAMNEENLPKTLSQVKFI
ncbi:MAG: hypothetical protein HY231_04870 [Acidobacteria bacterium]|nr:hypothetical protein [Acidobacteriota bacterium]